MDLRFHVKFDCLRRRVKCRFDFCKASFPLQDRLRYTLNEVEIDYFYHVICSHSTFIHRHESLYCAYIARRQELLEEAAAANVLQVTNYTSIYYYKTDSMLSD